VDVGHLTELNRREGGYAEVGRIIHGHPTLSEGVMEAARATRSPIACASRPLFFR
jgi:hypothetical protein